MIRNHKNEVVYLLLCMVGTLLLVNLHTKPTLNKMRNYHKIGVAKWCMVNKAEKTIQCNYETLGDCTGYQGPNESCILNQDYK